MSVLVRWTMEEAVCNAYEAVRVKSSGLHGHHHFLLTLITEGMGVQTLNGRDILFQPDDVFFLSPADFHKNTLREGESFSYYGLKFSYELLDDRLAELCALDQLPMYMHLGETEAKIAKDVFRQLINECNQGEDRLGSKVYQQALAEQLIILVLRQCLPEEKIRPAAFVNRALGYLHSHFSEPITVAEAAAYVGYTPNYFNTCFREQIGIPFGEYLRQMRLGYGENLLRSSQMPVTEVAYESGFGSLSYFSRCFCKQYGISPQEYRKNIRKIVLNYEILERRSGETGYG